MKITLFFLMLALPVLALPMFTISFPTVNEKVVVETKNAECTTPKKVSESYYQMNCKTASVPVMLIREFKYPATILTEIKNTNYEDVKKLGEKAIKKKVHPWGTEYWWETPTSESSLRAYFCPNKKNHCYYSVFDRKFELKVYPK